MIVVNVMVNFKFVIHLRSWRLGVERFARNIYSVISPLYL